MNMRDMGLFVNLLRQFYRVSQTSHLSRYKVIFITASILIKSYSDSEMYLTGF